VRAGEGPRFVALQTYRFRPHSMFDPMLYRGKQEVEEWKRRDPIPALAGLAERCGWFGEAERRRLEDEIRTEIDDAVAFAEASPCEPVHDLDRFVYRSGGER
jgi:TPP-dependent pyruvate/acetoin dehydrogenase alpha subunit